MAFHGVLHPPTDSSKSQVKDAFTTSKCGISIEYFAAYSMFLKRNDKVHGTSLVALERKVSESRMHHIHPLYSSSKT